MIKFLIDSSYCFSEELANKYDISVLETCVTIQDTLYYSSPFWKTVDIDYMLNYMKSGGLPKISQAPLQKWIDKIKDLLKTGDTYIYISPNRKFGGGLRSLNIIRNLNKDYENRLFAFEGIGSGTSTEIEVLDLIDRTKEDTTISEISDWISDLNKKIKCYVISESLLHWFNSGRSTVSTNFQKGYPLMKLSEEGDTFSPVYLGSSYEDSLSTFLSDIKDKNFKKCVISYTKDVPIENLNKFESVMSQIGCEIITEHLFSPNVTSVVGVNSISASFI